MNPIDGPVGLLLMVVARLALVAKRIALAYVGSARHTGP
jgi:hypothetical protein